MNGQSSLGTTEEASIIICDGWKWVQIKVKVEDTDWNRSFPMNTN